MYTVRPAAAHFFLGVNASAFITQALEDNWSDAQQSDIYAEYIATRPRVERFGSHGLFSDGDYVYFA